MPLVQLLLLALSSCSVFSSPLILDPNNNNGFSLAFAARINVTGFLNIVEADRARAALLISRTEAGGKDPHREGHIVNVTNSIVTYIASVGVGTPPTQYNLVVDTGSSNTWIGSGTPYERTSTSESTSDSVYVEYGSGFFWGNEYTDTVTLSRDLVIDAQSIGVATVAEGFSDVDGILGVGPVDLTIGTLSNKTKSVPTVTDMLHTQKKINANVLSLFYQPSTLENAPGQMDFGGYDASKIIQKPLYVPITKTRPASFYWGIDQTISYGGKQILKSSGITDSGTTLILLATDAFNKYKTATGAKLDKDTGLLTVTAANYHKIKNLVFTIGGKQFILTPNAQIWPRELNSQIGGKEGNVYLIVSDIGQRSGNGLDFINGYTFLQRFYTIYDTTSKRIGFAPTRFTNAMTN